MILLSSLKCFHMHRTVHANINTCDFWLFWSQSGAWPQDLPGAFRLRFVSCQVKIHSRGWRMEQFCSMLVWFWELPVHAWEMGPNISQMLCRGLALCSFSGRQDITEHVHNASNSAPSLVPECWSWDHPHCMYVSSLLASLLEWVNQVLLKQKLSVLLWTFASALQEAWCSLHHTWFPLGHPPHRQCRLACPLH